MTLLLWIGLLMCALVFALECAAVGLTAWGSKRWAGHNVILADGRKRRCWACTRWPT